MFEDHTLVRVYDFEVDMYKLPRVLMPKYFVQSFPRIWIVWTKSSFLRGIPLIFTHFLS